MMVSFPIIMRLLLVITRVKKATALFGFQYTSNAMLE